MRVFYNNLYYDVENKKITKREIQNRWPGEDPDKIGNFFKIKYGIEYLTEEPKADELKVEKPKPKRGKKEEVNVDNGSGDNQ